MSVHNLRFVLKHHGIPHLKLTDPYFLSLDYLPLRSNAPFKVIMKFCNISKTITARSFKLGQLIEDESILPGEGLKKYIFFFSYCPLQSWT